MSSVAISVVIASYNDSATIEKSVRSIIATAKNPVEVIVVDDGSSDSTGELAESAGAKVLRPGRIGQPKCLNMGIAAAAGNEIVIADGDIEVLTQSWDSLFLETAYSRPDAGQLVPKYLLDTPGPVPLLNSVGCSILSWIHGGRQNHVDIGRNQPDLGQHDIPCEVDVSATPFCFMRREAITKVGGYDEAYSPYLMNDGDLSMMMRREGYSVWTIPGIKVIHRVSEKAKKKTDFSIPDFLPRLLDHWKQKWGWDYNYPDIRKVRERWGDTKICWSLGHNRPGPEAIPNRHVDVCLVTSNRLERLKKTIACLLETDYEDFSILVLDNGSQDGTWDYLGSLSGEKVKAFRTPVNIGHPAGCNWIASQSGSGLMAICDDDIIPQRNWLTALVETLERFPRCGLVGCKVLEENGEKTQFAAMRLWPTRRCNPLHSGLPRDQYSSMEYNSIICGCCCLFRKAAFDAVGGFDLAFSPSQFDDVDLCLKLWRSNYEVIYNGHVEVRHCQNPQTVNGSFGNRMASMNHRKLCEKWGGEAFEVLERTIDGSGRVINWRPSCTITP